MIISKINYVIQHLRQRFKKPTTYNEWEEWEQYWKSMELKGDVEVAQQDWNFQGGMNKMKRQSNCNHWNFVMRRNNWVNLNLQGSHQFPLDSSRVVVEEASIWRNIVSKKVCLVWHNRSTVCWTVEKRDRSQQPEMREASYDSRVVASKVITKFQQIRI